MKKIHWKLYTYCLVLSALFLMICTKSSPLYKLNDWVDAQAFFTVGKSMMRGPIPYLDLFEQKGPLLYFIYGIASLIDYHSFFGVYLLEVLSCSICLYYSFKVLRLYCSKESAILLLPIFISLILPLRSFTHGGSAEEFCFPFLIYSLYQLFLYFKKKTISRQTIFLVGVCAGCVLWIKYSLLGFWFAWMMVVFFLELFEKKWKEAFLHCFLFLVGMLATSLPWLIYFGIQHGIPALIEVYFTFNMKLYASNISLLDKIMNCCDTMIMVFQQYKIFTILIIMPILFSLFIPFLSNQKRHSICLLICVFFLAFGILIGGTYYRYYSLLIAPLIIIGFIGIGILLDYIKWKRYYIYPFCLIIITCSFLYAYQKSPNTIMLSLKKSDYAQYTFAEIINQYENPTLLNYGFLDGGFYSTTGIIPNCYFFMRNNISHRIFPKLLDEQQDYIINEKVDFVVVRGPLSNHHSFLESNYRLVSKQTQMYQSKKIEYFLFQKKKLKID